MFYTQFVTHSAQSAVRSPQQPCLFRQYARGGAFITKTKTIILFTNTAWIVLALGKLLLSIFTSETMKRKTCRCIKVIPCELNSFPVILTISLGLCYIFCAQKSRPAKKRVHNMQPNYSFLFVRKVRIS